MIYIKDFSNKIIANKSAIVYSIASSFIILIISYFVNNLPIFTGEKLNQQLLSQYCCEKLGIEEEICMDSILFINVSHDKQLAYEIKNGDTLSTNPITDRRKLVDFLKLLQESRTDTSSYKYLILDIMFCKGDSTQYDDELFKIISDMDNVVFVAHDSIEISHPDLSPKAAIAEYQTTITGSNFTRYEYIHNNQRLLPLQVYENLYPAGVFHSYGWGNLSVFFSRHKLCNKSMFITFNTQSFEHKQIIDSLTSINLYYDLGNDILNNIDEAIPSMNRANTIRNSIIPLTNNKIIIIGDLINDVHDTYTGKKSGSYIIIRALQSLIQEKHIIKLSHIIIWFLTYFLISLFIRTDKTFTSCLPFIKKTKHKVIPFFFDLISFASIIFCIQFIEYINSWSVYSVVVPIIYFTLMKLIRKLKCY